MTLRPVTRLSIDDYRFDPAAPALNRQNLSADQGGFRAATGAVADSNREGYRVASPWGWWGSGHQLRGRADPIQQPRVGRL